MTTDYTATYTVIARMSEDQYKSNGRECKLYSNFSNMKSNDLNPR